MLKGLTPLPSCKVADITCVKAFSSWIVSLAVLKDYVFEGSTSRRMLTICALIFLSSSPCLGKKRALVFSFQFPTVEPWEDYVILRLESSAACGIILRTEHARGAFCFLAVIVE